MSELADIVEAKIEEFDALREVFFEDDGTCYLLKLDGDEVSFEVVIQLVSGWYLEYSKFRSRFELFYAELETDFKEKYACASHVSINGDVYAISEGDTVPPQGEEPFWIIPCTLSGGKFTP